MDAHAEFTVWVGDQPDTFRFSETNGHTFMRIGPAGKIAAMIGFRPESRVEMLLALRQAITDHLSEVNAAGRINPVDPAKEA